MNYFRISDPATHTRVCDEIGRGVSELVALANGPLRDRFIQVTGASPTACAETEAGVIVIAEAIIANSNYLPDRAMYTAAAQADWEAKPKVINGRAFLDRARQLQLFVRFDPERDDGFSVHFSIGEVNGLGRTPTRLLYGTFPGRAEDALKGLGWRPMR